MSKPIIICVDDEKIIVDSLKSEIKNAFKELLIVEIAESGAEALEIVEDCIAKNIDIPIVISDWQMPEMKGDEFLSKVHSLLPNTKKILLTGQVTTSGLGNAVNLANLYRFIPKPWHAEDLDLTITEAFKSYYNQIQLTKAMLKLNDINALLEDKIKLRTAELEESNKKNQVLLDQTLFGTINALIKILMKSNPEIFSKAYRIRNYTKRLLKHLDIKNIWEIEIACLFSQLGCIDLPPVLLEKISKNDKLTQQELSTFRLHPHKTYDLIAGIPIFGNIAQGILDHLKASNQLIHNESYNISVLLRLASDFDDLIQSGKSESEAMDVIRKNQALYDRSIINTLIRDIYEQDVQMNHPYDDNILMLSVREIKVGYVFAQDVFDEKNNIIFTKDEEITKLVLTDLIQISRNKIIKEPVFVYNYFLI